MRILTLVLALLSTQGCVQTLAIRTMGGIMDDGFEAFNEESDLGIARDALGSNLKLVEAMIKGDPENAHLLLLASQGFSAYALSFVEDDSVERARGLYLRGRDYALRILEQRTSRTGLADLDEAAFNKVLQHLDADDVPAVFWAAFGWGSYINISRSELTALADLPRVNAMMEFVLAHDREYYHSGADLYFGSIKGSLPVMLGGDPEGSRTHFERAITATNGTFLMAYVYYAKTYAVQLQDRELYVSLLQKVEEMPLDRAPEVRLANAVAKQKARRMMERAADLF